VAEPAHDCDGSGSGSGTKFKINERVFYFYSAHEDPSFATITKINSPDTANNTYTIEINGRGEMPDVPECKLDFIVVCETVNKVLGILNVCDETRKYLKDNCPREEHFERFLKRPFTVIKDDYKQHEDCKEPRFKRIDREEFIILSRWTNENIVGGIPNWVDFNEGSFNDFCEKAPKDDLYKILKELGINNEKVVDTLQAKSVQTAAHFAQKPRSWYDKLCEEESGTEQNSKQKKNHLLSGIEKHEIDKFKDWYSFHSIGYLPSDWIVSFRNDDVHQKQKERDLRKVLRVIGLNADAIEALEMNGIIDIATLIRTSYQWWRQDKWKHYAGFPWEPINESWKRMGLTWSDASDIINFRHWHNFYVRGKKNVKGWTAEFNSAQYNDFLQRYVSGNSFRPSPWKFWQHDSLKSSQERHDYYDIIQRAAESGDVTEAQSFHLLNYMEKREKRSVLEEITSQHAEGFGDSTLEEDRLRELLNRDDQRADEKEKSDLFFGQQFCQFFFSAFLVLVLLTSWMGTTGYFMMESLREKKVPDGEPGFKPHPGFDYMTFIHNILFGLVSAVVIQELGEEAKETSLYCRILPTYREQRRREKEYRILTRGNVVRCWSRTVQLFKTFLMWIILWSTRFYIIVWICLGAASLAFGAIIGIDNSNPLYTTGQTWLGIAVTIGYTYFGLNGKKAPEAEPIRNENDQQPDDAVQNMIDEGGVNDTNMSATTSSLEAKFTNEGGTTKVLKTRHELMKDIDTYDEMKERACTERRFKEAAGYQKCLEQLDKLKQILPTKAELEKQLKEAEKEMNAAADANNFDAAEKISEAVEKLQEKIKEERNEEETWPGGDSTV